MPQVSDRAYSRYSREALTLLGQMIRMARIERKITTQELSERAGISRTLLQRIERGDPGCAIGAVFEAATIAGVPLFTPERGGLTLQINDVESRLTLLPKTVRRPKPVINDDF
ncbi:helix-turn-helix transcriptional regulator [Asticcacaulis sp. YBE204]|uniref:helix-turn-helix transcriptional regulator n=1 Tax=Asticcacaulis sp. YBE204 TaxID=1282363 RepID=UPI0003C410CC|nr:helix-turn-helix transcriptional regulator [Asticcacaulis sp. YBE204]ESQ80967.1 hypothetical protein AEYBE204_01195 [Asticcacaulis sp. YBE204]